MKKIRISTESLFKALNLSDSVNKNTHEIYVDTPNGLQPVLNFMNMGNKDIYEVKLDNGNSHRVAESHIFMDIQGKEVLVTEASEIKTKDGIASVISTSFLRKDNTYDIEIPYPNWYYGSKGIVHHNCVAMEINGGKSTFLVQQAADWLIAGDDVLYISMEMSEQAVRERIDVVVTDSTFDGVLAMDKATYMSKINAIRQKTMGRLFVKEYPAESANVNHFRHLLQELKIKKSFVPKVIMLDYLTITASCKLPPSAKGNTNTYYTSVASEIRAFAQEQNLPIWTGLQFDRNTQGKADANMGNVGLAIGIAATTDFMVGFMNPTEMSSRGQVIGKVLKNRYGDFKGKFLLGMNPAKQRFYDVDAQASAMTEEELKELGLTNIIPQNSPKIDMKQATMAWDFD